MARPSKTAKLVITSIVITLIVLAAFTLIFISFIVPAYQITEEQIYTVLTRLFPVLIGLILIQIGVMAAKKGEPEYKDTIDRLSPNSYDSPLYSSPKDDPMLRGRIDPEVFAAGGASAAAGKEAREIVKEVPVEVVKEVPVEIVREVEVPIEKIREIQVPVEVVKEVPVEKIVEKEVIKEVPIEVVREVPVEVVKEVPVEKIIEKEVPVEVVKEVPVEVIKEVAVEKEVEVPAAAETRMLSFREVLKEETKAACDMNYDISLVAIKERDGLTEEQVEASFEEDTLVFSEDGCFYAILPLFSKEEAEEATESLAPRNVCTVSGKDIEPDEFIREASRF